MFEVSYAEIEASDYERKTLGLLYRCMRVLTIFK